MYTYRIEIGYDVPSDYIIGRRYTSIWADTPKEALSIANDRADEIAEYAHNLRFEYIIENRDGNRIYCDHCTKKRFMAHK